MPVTTRASPVEVKPAQKLGTYDAEKLLSASAPSVYHPWEGKKLLDSSFVDTQTVSPAHNGFIETVLDAYNRHHHLVLRPEDVWFAILVQFSFYVNKHSENLRKYFVEHEGKKKLKVETESGMRDVVLRMTDLITENVKDPSLRGWIMPSFTTTTQQDRIAAAIIMMGTMQKYFVYMCEQTCGIPSVTLLGEKSDWEDILERIQFLGTFGSQHEELLIWNSVLTTLVSHFVRTFEAPDSPAVVKFWQSAVHDYIEGYTGYRILTGWIQAFAFWDADGTPLVVDNIRKSTSNWRKDVKKNGMENWLDTARLGQLRWDEVPVGHVHVPIHVNDNGNKFMAKAIAGSIGWRVFDSEAFFNKTRKVEKIDAGPHKKTTMTRFKTTSKSQKASEPSTFSGSTLAESMAKPSVGLLRSIIQRLSCFGSDGDRVQVYPAKPWKPQSVDDPVAEASKDNIAEDPPANNLFWPNLLTMNRVEIAAHTPKGPNGPISDLSELTRPWEYEEGGKNDTLQPVTGWWIIRTPEGQYGRDPDCPGVQFDSDAEDYDEQRAMGGQGVVSDYVSVLDPMQFRVS